MTHIRRSYWLVPADMMTFGSISRDRVLVTWHAVAPNLLADDAIGGFSHQARPRLDGAVYLVSTLDGYLPPTWRDGAVTAIGDDAREALATDPAWTPPEEPTT